jgi:hypothetical protein
LPHPESGASEVNNEKAEQPSPVSVLDSPFQEETPSPKGFKEISSNLQGKSFKPLKGHTVLVSNRAFTFFCKYF